MRTKPKSSTQTKGFAVTVHFDERTRFHLPDKLLADLIASTAASAVQFLTTGSIPLVTCQVVEPKEGK